MDIILLPLILLGVFEAVCLIVMARDHCSHEKAAMKVRAFLRGKDTTPISMAQDAGYCDDINTALRDTLGEKRYNDLVALNNTLCLAGKMTVIWNNTDGGLPCVRVTVQPKDDIEKKTIEAVLVSITQKHLVSNGFPMLVDAIWKTRQDINMPYLEIVYSEDDDQLARLKQVIAGVGLAVLAANRPLTDDTETDDLTDDG